MAIFIQLYQSERNGTTKGKWYGRTKIVGTKTLKDIAEHIQRNASMKKSDVWAVLTEVPEVLSEMLCDGYRVKIDGFGAFKISVSTSPAKTAKDFDMDKNIKSSRILFQPETEKDGSHGTRSRVLARKLDFKNVETMTKTKKKK